MKTVSQWVLAVGVLFVPLCAQADLIYGTIAPMTGSAELSGFGDWVDAEISWHIIAVNGLYWYSYGFEHSGSDLSHLVLEFSKSCAGDSQCITGSTNETDGPRVFSAFKPPNFEMPIDLFGVKFGEFQGSGPDVWSFVSNRPPVYGNVYLRSGGNAYAYNAGLLDQDSPFSAAFIGRPDGWTAEIPEPATLLLVSLTLVLIAYRRWRIGIS